MGSEHEQLAASDPVIAAAARSVGETSIAERRARRPDVDAYGMLLRSVVGQQLSVKAAATIYGRVLDLFGGATPAPQALLDVDPQRLREAGLSGRKVEYVRDLAEHVLSGELELDRLDELSDEEVVAEITAVRGFGVWSAQMFLIFFLERPDVLPAGDLGIRKAVQLAYEPRRDAEGGGADRGSPSRGARTGPSPRWFSGRASTTSRCVRPGAHLLSDRPPSFRPGMPSLISFEEALELAEVHDREGITAIVERAWEVRTERFGDSTDMCSLVNAKSGGCAEDCGFCAQSRYAEADTPMHAMMEPEQILEHAKAAEAAGAHRFCMVTQGQGLSKRDFEKILAGARLVAEQTNLKRCASVGHISPDAGAASSPRPASSASTTTSRPPAPTTTRSRRRSATRAASGRSRRSRRPASRPASAASSTSARARASGSRWRSSSPRSTRPRCRSTCSTRGPGRSSATAS